MRGVARHQAAVGPREGELLTLDGNEGVFYAGTAQVEIEYLEELIARLGALRQHARKTRSKPIRQELAASGRASP